MMSLTHNAPYLDVGVAQPEQNDWVHRRVVGTAALRKVIDDLVGRMRRAGYPPADLFSVRLAAEEAAVNAVKHGHKETPHKPVRFGYHVTAAEVLVEVEDQGPGFKPAAVPDPLQEDRLEVSSGRGLLLMRCYTTWLRHNDRGNLVTFCRRRSIVEEI